MRAGTKILAVIVLYKCKMDDSSAFQSLKRTSDICPDVELKTLIFDNSPIMQCAPSLPKNFTYERSARNEGLAAGYNRALEMALTVDCKWLLTLDQDTTLPEDFLLTLSEIAIRLQHDEDESVAAIVPQMMSGDLPLSPMYVHWLRSHPAPRGFTGFNQGELYAFNSAALLRVAALRELGGFSTEFWLDQLDLWLHHQLYRAGKRVFVAGNVQIEHKLSLLDYKSLAPARYRNFLEAESAFFDRFRGRVANRVLTATLLVRYYKQKKRGDSPSIRQLTKEHLKRRLFQSRNRRLDDWKNQVQIRLLSSPDAVPAGRTAIVRPSVSVCMATYCGERFVAAQIASILSQLSPDDELIVVDDASSDRTCEIIENLHDARIRLRRHGANQGVLRSFEDAIRQAVGDIVFLSDQDDLWAVDKVATVLGTFQLRPEADIVVSDAAVIDGDDNPLGCSYYAQKGKFRSGILANLVHCSYLGCTMAFRRRIRSRILPFPSGADVFHDLWIGAANTLAGGKTLYIERPLVLYRRHPGNATGNRQLTLGRQIRIRWDLCRSLAEFWLRTHRLGAR
jgi:glycosyltransferase involved in cell wall biosynthesis